MIIIVSKIIFILSLAGLLFIVFRKLPKLSQLPERGPYTSRFSLKSTIFGFKGNIRQFIASDFFQNTILGNLEKSLRKIKILILKIDNRVDKIIRRLKRRAEE